MYVSETESSNWVHNLNDNILYIELPKKYVKEKDYVKIRMDIAESKGLNIKEEISDNNQFIKLTFSFDGNPKFKHLLSEKIEYKVSIKYGDNKEFEFDEGDLPLMVKRLLLNTDQDFSKNRNMSPIETNKIWFTSISGDKSLKFGDNSNFPLAKVQLVYKDLIAKIIGNGEQFNLSVHKNTDTDNNSYIDITTNNLAESEAKLEFTIEGDSGYKLVITRDLKIASESKLKIKLLSVPLDEEKLSDSQKDLSNTLENESVKETPPQNKNEPNSKESKPIEQSPSETDLPEIKQEEQVEDNPIDSEQEQPLADNPAVKKDETDYIKE
ncbi:hypothetical protein [Carnobacterium funditum]|uniref:hypothetical protein n=1 Tax=Carnobacterium funditum TaxID=2752 RepID=UPI0005571592|nr:hypothetical protein [Carnobacterium funditum]